MNRIRSMLTGAMLAAFVAVLVATTPSPSQAIMVPPAKAVTVSGSSSAGTFTNHIRTGCNIDGAFLTSGYACTDGTCDTEGEECNYALPTSLTSRRR